MCAPCAGGHIQCCLQFLLWRRPPETGTPFVARNVTIPYQSQLSAFALTFPLLAANAAHAQTVSDDDGMTFMVTLLLTCALIYILPSIVAFSRGHPNRWLIFAINIVFGGTGFGWLGSLIWAFGAVHRSPTGNHGGESGLNLFANDTVRVEARVQPTLLYAYSDPADELVRLKRLFDAGAINEREYQSLRVAPLNRLAEER